MNLNLNGAVGRESLNSSPLGNGDTLQEQIRQNARIIQNNEGPILTGQVALVMTDSDLDGVYAVWHETDGGTWVWVDDEGVQHEEPCPIDGTLR